MVFKKPRTSRDDKSAGSPRGRSKGGDATKRPSGPSKGKFSAKSDGHDNPKKKFDNDKPGEKRSSFSSGKPYSGKSAGGDDRPKRSYGSDTGDRKPYSSEGKRPYTGRPSADSDRPKKSYGSDDRPKKIFGSDSGDKKTFSPAGKRPYTGRPTDTDRPQRSFGTDSDRPKRNFDDKPSGDKRPYSGRTSDSDGPKKTFGADRPTASCGKSTDDRPKRSFGADTGDKKFNRRPAESGPKKRATGGYSDRPKRTFDDAPASDAPERNMRERKKPATESKQAADKGLIRLNRYIANAGICSRRKADELIEAGVVSVNGVVISELGHKVDPAKDEVRYNNETLKREKNVYVLLNKPKDYITTTDDPMERRTVMHLVEKASKERIYPIGRLDRNTTGLLLMTNDGDLADKLSHPRSNIVKLYQVELSKPLIQGDMNKIGFGIELEDGLIKPDSVSYVAGGTKREIGIQIHSGKNRIVRRIFEHLGYEVVKLDRVVYAGLTKKDLPRGRWRYLEEKEIIQLKHLI
ncbi:MAG: pseudouridine synthase [Mucilaginibacter sp.]